MMYDTKELKPEKYAVDTLRIMGKVNEYINNVVTDDSNMEFSYNKGVKEGIQRLIHFVEKDAYHSEGKSNPLAEELKSFNNSGIYTTKKASEFLFSMKEKYFPGLRFLETKTGVLKPQSLDYFLK